MQIVKFVSLDFQALEVFLLNLPLVLHCPKLKVCYQTVEPVQSMLLSELLLQLVLGLAVLAVAVGYFLLLEQLTLKPLLLEETLAGPVLEVVPVVLEVSELQPLL